MAERKHFVRYEEEEEIVYNVNCFMEEEAKTGIRGNNQILERTAAATGISIAMVKEILKDYEHASLKNETPNTINLKPITDVDCFDQGIIRRLIHNFHLIYKELPTLEKLKNVLQKEINFQGTEEKLRQIIEILGFTWKKVQDNKKIIIEDNETRFKRIAYFGKIENYENGGRPIIYADESFVEIPHSNGQRIVILLAGSTEGILLNTLLTFKVERNIGMYCKRSNAKTYENWVRTRLMPNIPNNSVVVFDNLLYYRNQYYPEPTSLSKTSEMKAWITKKGIDYSEDMLKPQLYKIIKSYKPHHHLNKIKKILVENNYDFLQLPTYHSELSPLKAIWASTQEYIISKSVTWDAIEIKELVQEKVNSITVSDWKSVDEKLKDLKTQYLKNEVIIDMMTDEFIVQRDYDESEDETNI